jgi:outer membrane autotransporter protein
LNAISGQPYADFGTLNVQGGALFMNTVAQQMAVARGAAGGGQRQALAQACEIASCDATSPWGTWASALGGLGTVAGNGNASTLTYNFGGGAAGVDYRVDPRFLVGLGAGYAAANQWVDSFMGRGWTDSISVMAYGSFTPMGTLAGFYADALAGYAWSGNQMQRQILIAGLQPRTANGSTGANQFLGQVETGYRLAVFAPAAASVTPFARLQGSTVNQNGFSEWGAQSLSLNVAQQTTNSLRTTFGANLAGAIGLGEERKLDLALRLGWLHEYADTGRPITAAFAGAPSSAFTVYGATPQRDSAIIGFSAGTAIAQAAQLYLRYDGEIGTMAANHTLNLGVRVAW